MESVLDIAYTTTIAGFLAVLMSVALPLLVMKYFVAKRK